MALPTVLAILHQQFLNDTDPAKDFTKETLAQMQARHERIKKNYRKFFQSMTALGLPEGGAEGQVLSKLSDDDFDVAWLDIPFPESVEQGIHNLDGGAAYSIYLTVQHVDGGSASNILI